MVVKHIITNSPGDGSTGFRQAVQDYLVPDYFASAENAGTYGMNFKDADGNILFNGDWSGNAFRFTWYRSNSATGFIDLQTYLVAVYTCTNGVFFVYSDTYNETSPTSANNIIAFTKDKNGVTGAAVFVSPSDKKYYTFDWSDVDASTYYNVEWNSGQFTQFVPIATHASEGNPNYFHNAYYFPVSQIYTSGFGKFMDATNNEIYMTNGYIAIKDGGAT